MSTSAGFALPPITTVRLSADYSSDCSSDVGRIVVHTDDEPAHTDDVMAAPDDVMAAPDDVMAAPDDEGGEDQSDSGPSPLQQHPSAPPDDERDIQQVGMPQ